MSGPDQQAYQMPQRIKEKPGTLELVIGIALMCIAPFVLALNAQNDARYAQLKAEGVVSEATVKGKSQRRESYADSKGRNRVRTIYLLNVEHDFSAKTSYADWKRTGTAAKSRYPALTTSDIDAGSSAQEALAIGAKTTVIKLPLDSSSLMLTARLEEETSLAFHLKWYALMAGLFAAGLGIAVWGWRKRKAHG